MKAIGGVVLCALVAIGGGWLWGTSGRSALSQERRALVDRLDVATARAALAEGRLSVLLLNYGDARKHFDEALAVVTRLQARMREVGQVEQAGRLEIVLAHTRDASRLAAAVDASAQSAAEQALRTLAAVSGPI